MSVPRDVLLFGIALIAYGNWAVAAGQVGEPYALIGVVLAIVGFGGSVLSSLSSVSNGPGDMEE